MHPHLASGLARRESLWDRGSEQHQKCDNSLKHFLFPYTCYGGHKQLLRHYTRPNGKYIKTRAKCNDSWLRDTQVYGFPSGVRCSCRVEISAKLSSFQRTRDSEYRRKLEDLTAGAFSSPGRGSSQRRCRTRMMEIDPARGIRRKERPIAAAYLFVPS